jgi:hypothetical protein
MKLVNIVHTKLKKSKYFLNIQIEKHEVKLYNL